MVPEIFLSAEVHMCEQPQGLARMEVYSIKSNMKYSVLLSQNIQCIYMYMYLFEQSVNTLDKSKFEHRRGGGVETDREDVGIAVVTSELSYQACDHHA